jgi:hypothetical protein
MATQQRQTSHEATLSIVRIYRPDPQRHLQALRILLNASPTYARAEPQRIGNAASPRVTIGNRQPLSEAWLHRFREKQDRRKRMPSVLGACAFCLTHLRALSACGVTQFG